MEHNFNKITKNYDYQNTNYDYYSVMHYDAYAFSTNGQSTIVPKQSGVQLLNAALKDALSSDDVSEIRKAYGATENTINKICNKLLIYNKLFLQYN